VGPNGAGKSTLLRCLAALDRPFSGAVRIDGVDTQDDPRRVHERVGYLPDFFGLYDELTVRQNLIYAAEARGVRAGAARTAAEAASARVGLADRTEARARDLSRGLRQRLAIAQTIVHAPGALLLDEPAAGLDPEARRSLSALITTLAGEGMAIIVSSHILAELEDYCTAMLVMKDGALVGGAPIAASGNGSGPSVRIALARPDPRLRAVLEGFAGARVLQANEREALVGLGGDEAQAALLAVLVDAGFRVKAFAEERASLEAAYMAAQAEGR
jgi:ABC-2 type transport system ATP-binding protein